MTALTEIEDHPTAGGVVRVLRLSRPPVNALNPTLCRELIAAFEHALGDDVRGVVLAGNSRIFSAGLDVPFLLSLGDDRRALHEAWQAFFGAARQLARARVPVVAALTGHAPAGGCVLALCCDYRVMARSPDPAKPMLIGLNEVEVGLPVPDGIQRLMRRVVGAHRAERLLVSGTMVSAEQALEIGLVDELAVAEDVVARAIAWLETLLQRPHQPMLKTRTIAREDLIESLSSDYINLDRFVEDWYEPDTQAGLKALVARLKK